MHQVEFAPQILSLGPGKCSPSSPWGQPQAGPFLLLLFLDFLGSAAPQILGKLSLGGCGSLGVCVFPALEQGDVSFSTAPATGHGTLQRRLAFQLHVNGSWKEKVSVVFPSCLPGGDNLEFLECKVVLGHLSACRQSEAMEPGLEPTPGSRELWVQARSRERLLLWRFSSHPPQNMPRWGARRGSLQHYPLQPGWRRGKGSSGELSPGSPQHGAVGVPGDTSAVAANTGSSHHHPSC